jgi:hypothetical protein
MTLDYTSMLLTGITLLALVAVKVWPMAKTMFLESAAFTKKVHDEYCGMRLATILQRLTSIEAHEKESTKKVAEIWKRLDTMGDTMHRNHIELLREIRRP